MKETNYIELFKELYDSGEKIIDNTTKEVFEAKPDEMFRQCWADTPERRIFPKYWFISNFGNLLSVKKYKIQWIHKNKREKSNKISYKFLAEREDEEGIVRCNVEEHDLVGLVWGSEAFGLAGELLKEKGLGAIGVNSKIKISVQGHHINQDDTDNSPENVKFVTDKVHIMLENAPKHDDSEERHMEYMGDLGKLMSKENPHSMTIVFSGEVFDMKTGTWRDDGDIDVFATKKIKLSPTAYMQIMNVLATINQE